MLNKSTSTFLVLATMTDWEMVFYGTILPPEQTHILPTISISQNLTSEDEPEQNFKSGECRVTTAKCLGLLLILCAIIPYF